MVYCSTGPSYMHSTTKPDEWLPPKTNLAWALDPSPSLQQQQTSLHVSTSAPVRPPTLPLPHTSVTYGLGRESHLICRDDLVGIAGVMPGDGDTNGARLESRLEDDLRMEPTGQNTLLQGWHTGGSKASGKDDPIAGDGANTRQFEQSGAISDSGYASTRLDKYGCITSARDSRSGLPLDAGYASVDQRTMPQKQTSLQMDAARTVYSDSSSVTTLQKESYISELAEDLFKKVVSWQPDAQRMERIFEALPEMLKAFALKVGHKAPSQMHRDVMVFIHKNRE